MKGRFSSISSNVFSKCRESFVEPQSIPPLHGYQITKPLRGGGGEESGHGPYTPVYIIYSGSFVWGLHKELTMFFLCWKPLSGGSVLWEVRRF